MRKCDDCKIILEDSARFCPKCGRPADDRPGASRTSGDVGSLLTSSNLHRIRGELDEAAADASKAMQQDPNNAEAASLLASIFEDRREIAEAAVWYKIAADLEPTNPVHKARLDRIGKALAAGDTGNWKKKILTIPTIWAAAVGLVALIVASVFFFRGGPTGPATRPVNNTSQQPIRVSTARPPSSKPAPSAGQRSSPGTLSGARQSSPAGGSAKTAAEVAIMGSLGESDAVAKSGGKVEDVFADPRQGVATVTFSMPGGGILTKDKVLGAAVEIARAIFAANSEVKFVTARCMVAFGGAGSSQIAFVGDTARQTIEQLPDKPTAELLNSTFANPWWNPQIR